MRVMHFITNKKSKTQKIIKNKNCAVIKSKERNLWMLIKNNREP